MEGHSKKESFSTLNSDTSTQITMPDETPAKVHAESDLQVKISEDPVGGVPHCPISQRMVQESVFSLLML